MRTQASRKDTAKAGREVFRTKYGEFREDGQAYIINRPDTPRPWINILCNGSYGVLISQAGGGFSFWEDANQARLTSWSQDLIRDEHGKYLFVRDEDSKDVWSISWKPVCAQYESYKVEHAVGSTTFIQQNHKIEARWTLVVPPNDALELWRVELRNLDSKPRRLSLFSYAEWCLGNGTDWHREFQKTFIETSYNPNLRAIVGVKRRLPMPPHISTGATEWPLSGFHAVNREVISYEGDKERFIGRCGRLSAPQAMTKDKLTNTTGRWNDSIASLQVTVTLAPNESKETIFLLGKYDSPEAAETMIHAYASPKGFERALDETQKLWEPFLNRLRVETPDPAFDLMTNVWLKYQAIGGRLWARSAYYQSSAAYGFRDQLQDSHVFLPLEPELTKKQILLHASHQYLDGAVQHYWFPLTGAGPKSGQTDTPLWLVYLTLSYITETDDLGILGERVPYLDGVERPLFDHCIRALERTLGRLGKRGLPLIGEGDWNDGLSAVGPKLRGESVWLGHFLYDVLGRWADVCEQLSARRAVRIAGATPAKLSSMARRYRKRSEVVKRAVNQHGWDGKWYWRATRDDGRMLGSKKNREGRIFLNAQTWAVIAGTATSARAKRAMASVEQQLNLDYGPLLLTPAFTQPDDTIGYISRYAPGARENGGVYSHAATWAIWAECLMGQGNIAHQTYTKICPPKRGMDPELYYAEPYVMPGNTDGPESPCFGKAGWTWYTGSAAWLLRIGTEWILGVRPVADGLLVDPCIPSGWNGFRMVRRFRGTTFQILVENPCHVCSGVAKVWLDGRKLKGAKLPDLRDGQTHQVRVVLGSGTKSATKLRKRI